MIKVHYPHPPRKLGFYLGYLLWLFITVATPSFILFLTWSRSIYYAMNIYLVLAVIFQICLWNGRKVYKWYADRYDKSVPKGGDVTHLNLSPDMYVNEGIMLAKSLEFKRLREFEIKAAQSEQSDIVWFMVDAKQEICLWLRAYKKSYVAIFYTWFRESQTLVTVFPEGLVLSKEGYQIETINTSFEAAYKYHLNQIAKLERIHGSPQKITSTEVLDSFAVRDQQLHGKHRKFTHIFGFLIAQFFDNLAIAGATYIPVALIVYFRNDMTIDSSTLICSGLSCFYVILCLTIRNSIFKGRDISKAKKKET